MQFKEDYYQIGVGRIRRMSGQLSWTIQGHLIRRERGGALIEKLPKMELDIKYRRTESHQ